MRLPAILSCVAHLLGQVTMRVDQRKAATCMKVAECQRFHQGRFSDARFAEDVHMRKAVGLPDPEARELLMAIGLAEI